MISTTSHLLDCMAILFGAFFIGFFASGTYIVAVKMRFSGGNARWQRDISRLFSKPKNVLMHMFAGGFISMCLQWVDVNNFVPFQALITGITWPAFVSSFLSGKQAGQDETPYKNDDSSKEISEIRSAMLDLDFNSQKDYMGGALSNRGGDDSGN